MKFLRLNIMAALLVLSAAVLPAAAGEIHVSAAASLRESLTELSAAFERSNPGVKIVKNFAASGTLAKQIESGVPADIFISANKEWVDYLRDKKLLFPSSITIFTCNTLVFAGSAPKAASMKDLPSLERIAIGSPKSVPAGEYAMEALKKSGLDRALEKKLVMAKDVREALVYADRGEVDGAFVYRTDALQAKRAKILFSVPRNLYGQVTYPMALTATGARSTEAVKFERFLRSPEAEKVLERYGFAAK